ncbi:MerR family transcriptional regulator [Nocardia rosealba]|uniref:MerR family transcriptional regulator n=1 Tax=Nocardia rosealba TaxID=2878563 RepID=UPI001CDA27B3|nr:MerR family transcriptional regulator [Nocardia rosealba]MCA2209026.1 MerR family transcriptional regulator [Nocardia rosealba]
MFSIGDFARHGQVSVRMLRHYDAVGLLRPARVDPATGYRFYSAAQLARLNRIVALKGLGFSLEQVGRMLEPGPQPRELRGMLTLRRAELEQRLAADRARLTEVEARLRIIEKEGVMPEQDVVIKSVPAVRVARSSGVAAGFEPAHVSPVIQPLFEGLSDRLAQAGIAIAGPAIAYYEPADDGTVRVHACVPVNAEPGAVPDISIVDLPAHDRVATTVYHGNVSGIGEAWQELGRWVEDNGYRTAAPVREVTLEWTPDPNGWVTELQEPLAAR